jgi:hypothetical protein
MNKIRRWYKKKFIPHLHFFDFSFNSPCFVENMDGVAYNSLPTACSIAAGIEHCKNTVPKIGNKNSQK